MTGAAAGIGFATARVFAEAGAAVVPIDLDQAMVNKAADDLGAAGHQALGLRCDIASEEQVKVCIEHAVAKLGRLEIACNNAGIHVPSAQTADASGQDFDRAIAVNLRGVWNCMKYEPVHMRDQGHGSVVNVSLNIGLAGSPVWGLIQRRNTASLA